MPPSVRSCGAHALTRPAGGWYLLREPIHIPALLAPSRSTERRPTQGLPLRDRLFHPRTLAPALLAAVVLVLAAACGTAQDPDANQCLVAQGGVLVASPCEAPGVTPVPTPTPSGPADGGGGNLTGGARVFVQVAGCGACHSIASIPQANGQVGPELSGVGARLDADAIRLSILDPNAELAAECPTGACEPDLMPQNFSETLTPEQIDQLVKLLVGLQ